MKKEKINRVSKNLILGTSSATRGSYYGNMGLFSNGENQRRADILNSLKSTNLFEILWYVCFFVGGVLCLALIRPFTFELCFAVLSLWLYMVANNLLAKGKIWGLIISIISSVLYVVVSFFAKVYGEVIINILLYIPLDIFAVITFGKNKNKNDDDVEVKKLNAKGFIISSVLTIVMTAVIFTILYFLPGQVYPLLNALSISLFLMALFIRNLRFKEFWWFNLLGNAISIAMWVVVSASASELLYSLPFALSSLASFLNNIYGIYMWQKIFKREHTNGLIYIKRGVKINRVITLRRSYREALKWDAQVEEDRKQRLGQENTNGK